MRGFIGIDIETTGLDPQEGQILEIGAVLFDRNLNPKAVLHLVAPDPVGLSRCKAEDLDSYVLDMHRKSGLLEEVERLEWDDEKAAAAMEEFHRSLVDWHETLGGPQPMLGSSVHFDRAWLAEHFPQIEEAFSHRNIDASSLREYAKVVNPDKLDGVTRNISSSATHRAVDDVMHSAELLKAMAAESWVA